MVWKSFLIALFAFVVALLAFSMTRPRVQPADQQNDKGVYSSTTQANSQDESWKALWQRTKRDPVAFFTAVLAGSTILLFIMALGQLWFLRDANKTNERVAEAAQQSAKAAQDNLVKLQRAFVTFRGMKYLSHTDPEGKVWWSLHFSWFNSGASPAKKVRFFVSKYFEDVDLPDDFKFEVPADRPTNFMGPQSSMETTGFSLNADELNAVRAGKKFMYLWGRADYRDIFDGTPDHVTKFAMRVVDFRGDPAKYWDDKTNIVEIINANSPSRYNCADEDCEGP